MDYLLIIKELVDKNNLTNKQLADKIGISSATIYNYYSGKTKPDIDFFIKCAELFGVKVDELLQYNRMYENNDSSTHIVNENIENYNRSNHVGDKQHNKNIITQNNTPPGNMKELLEAAYERIKEKQEVIEGQKEVISVKNELIENLKAEIERLKGE